MSAGGVFRRFVEEHSAPVVLTIATPEVEQICARRGGLLHDILQAYASPNDPSFAIRFERYSEVRPRTARNLEDALSSSFLGFNIEALPSNIDEIGSTQQGRPTGWTQTIDSLFLRGMAYSDAESMSSPVALLFVASTTDQDPLATLTELASPMHLPSCFKNGRFDPTVLRLYLLLHDVPYAPTSESIITAAFARIQAHFTSRLTRLLVLNGDTTLASTLTANLIENRPLFFPININPIITQNRMSQTDATAISHLCYDLFSTEIVPELERRVDYLSKHVSDHRKGVKNVLRSFWRKSDPVSKGSQSDASADSVKYRYDSSEGQTLLLADTFFILKDYEAAYSTYKLLREDFRSDNSNYHLSYICAMMAACQLCIDPKYGGKDIDAGLKLFRESAFPMNALIPESSELATTSICLAVLVASICISPQYVSIKAPKEAASIFLSAAYFCRHSIGGAYPHMSALLSERAATCFALAKQYRKYSLYSIISSQTYVSCRTPQAYRHALTLLAVACSVCSKQGWVELTTNTLESLIAVLGEMKADRRTALVVLLYGLSKSLTMISVETASSAYLSSSPHQRAASAALLSILKDASFTGYSIGSHLGHPHVVSAIQSALPIHNNDLGSMLEVNQLQAPLLDLDDISLHESSTQSPLSLNDSSTSHIDKLRYCALLEVEHSLILASQPSAFQERAYFDKAADLDDPVALSAYRLSWSNQFAIDQSIILRISIINPFDFELSLSEIFVQVLSINDDCEKLSEHGLPVSIIMQPFQRVLFEVPISLSSQGLYKVRGARWIICNRIRTCCTFDKRGILQHRTIHERSARVRAEDTSLSFQVIDVCERLSLIVDGLSDTIYDGEVVQVNISISNESSITVNDLVLRVGGALALIYVNGIEIKSTGPSNSLFYLPTTLSILSLNQVTVSALLHFHSSYMKRISDSKSVFSLVVCSRHMISTLESQVNRRYAYYHRSVELLPALSVKSRVIPQASSTSQLLLFNQILNNSMQNDFTIDGVLCLCQKNVIASMSESMVQNFPFTIGSNTSANSILTLSSISNSNGSMSAASAWMVSPHSISQEKAVSIIASYFEIFDRQESRLRSLLIEAKEETGAPKTITQVRKERNQSNQNLTEEDAEETAVVNDFFLETFAEKNSSVVMCNTWRNGNRIGCSPYLVRLPQSRASYNVPPLCGINNLEDGIVCTLSYEDNIVKSTYPVIIPVLLIVRSYYTSTLRITIEAQDTIRECDICNTGKQQLISDELRWVGRISHLQNELKAGDCLKFQFYASISSPGTFNLSRFKIITTDSLNSTTIAKTLNGRHLVSLVS